MTWVRYDDNVANHPKVAPLDDATYRLWREAIEWCAHNLSDGAIRGHQLPLTSVRATRVRALKLVEKGLWHPAGLACLSDKCPPSSGDGWVIHDYWQYQPTRERARAEQALKAERQARWLEGRKRGGKPDGKLDASPGASQDASPNGTRDGVKDASHSTSRDAVRDGAPAPPRPAPKGGVGTTSLPAPPAAYGGGAPAGGEKKVLCRTCGNPTTSAYHRNSCIRSDVIAEGYR